MTTTQPGTIRSATPVRLPAHGMSSAATSRMRDDYAAWAQRKAEHGARHQLMVGDTLAIMMWERNAYAVVTVTYVRPGESVNVTESFDGSTYSLTASDLIFRAGQAYAHFGQDHAQDPHVGVIVRADGTAHHITTNGHCHQCAK